ncbi:alpha/beta hydrolase fold domain-containing protein [Nocardia sp. NPDC088792]|uniref:alpha/beta hydrolase fold domain-containing protein n=1 Tax=Nocardia sp. NPDC088792 TaxID=3364332 RepID=UPI003808114C
MTTQRSAAPGVDRLARALLRGSAWALKILRPQAIRNFDVVIDGQTLDPGLRQAMGLYGLMPRKPMNAIPLRYSRAAMNFGGRMLGHAIPQRRIEDLEIPGNGGPIPARLYAPTTSTDTGALIVFFHGGGWTVGSIDACDNVCRFLADRSGIPVLSIGYRLAPEHPFPAAIQDAIAAYRFAHDNAEQLGGRPDRLVVAGESAGGNLAAVTAQHATAAGIPPAFQLLFCPITDLSRKRHSYSLFSDGYVLTEAHMDWFRNNYLSDPAQATDPRASPLLASDLSGLPPAYIAVSGFDPLRDEGEEYAHRLQNTGVPTTLRRHPTLIHGIIYGTAFGNAGRTVLLEAVSALHTALDAGLSPAPTVAGWNPLPHSDVRDARDRPSGPMC